MYSTGPWYKAKAICINIDPMPKNMLNLLGDKSIRGRSVRLIIKNKLPTMKNAAEMYMFEAVSNFYAICLVCFLMSYSAFEMAFSVAFSSSSPIL